MIYIVCPFLRDIKCMHGDVGKSINVQELRDIIHHRTGIPEKFLSVFNGRYYIHPGEVIPDESTVYLGLSLPGGKGGFGSMLRAIGAQIEKTTNREACRDLTGRRLRDINEEQRLKKWLAKKAERELEKARRKKERLERLKQLPKHDFHDPEYNKQRSELPERIDDALTKGLKKAVPVLSKKRKLTKTNDDNDEECKELLKKQCLLLGLDIPSELDSSDEDSQSSESESGPNDGSSEDTSDSFGAGCSKSLITQKVPEKVVDVLSSESTASNSSNSQGLEESSSTIKVDGEKSCDHKELKGSKKEEQSISEPSQETKSKNSELSVDNGEESKQAVSADDPCKNSTPEVGLKEEVTNQKEGSASEGSSHCIPAACPEIPSKGEEDGPVDLMSFSSINELESLGLDKLKSVLMSLGLKCGGTLTERAQRLWSVRGLDPEKYPTSLKAKTKKK